MSLAAAGLLTGIARSRFVCLSVVSPRDSHYMFQLCFSNIFSYSVFLLYLKEPPVVVVSPRDSH